MLTPICFCLLPDLLERPLKALQAQTQAQAAGQGSSKTQEKSQSAIFWQSWYSWGAWVKNFLEVLKWHCWHQGPTGRCFQFRDGSGSGIGKNFGFGFGYGSGSGIGTIFLINRVLSGIQNLDRVFFGYIPNTAFTSGNMWLNNFWDGNFLNFTIWITKGKKLLIEITK